MSTTAPPSTQPSRAALLSGLSAYLLWGTLPLFITPLGKHILAPLIVCQRVLWSVVLLTLVLSLKPRGWSDVGRILRTRSTLGALILSSLLISANWLLFVYVTTHGQTLQAALGYFLTPLLSATLGMLVFRERLRAMQWVALALAFLGVAYFTVTMRVLPTYALLLALTFAFYGLVRKLAQVDALTGLFIETAILLLPACGILAWAHQHNLFGGRPTGWLLVILAVGCSLWTTIPLLLFAYAARRLQLTTLGFLQYIGPTCQFLLAVYVFGEHFTAVYAVTLPIIWLGVAVFMTDALIRARTALRQPAPRPDTLPTPTAAAASTR